MLRVNLNMLLAERNLTASRLSKDTGISKTTLTALVNNTGKGIQYETIDTICNYLNVTPNDFFDYVPLDYVFDYETQHIDLLGDLEAKMMNNELYLEDVKHEFIFYIDIKSKRSNKVFAFEGTVNIDKSIPFLRPIHFTLEFIEENDFRLFYELFFDEISKGLQAGFNRHVENYITDSFKEVLHNAIEEYDNAIFSLDFDDPEFVLPWDLPF